MSFIFCFSTVFSSFSTVFFDLNPSMLANGDNQLRVTLTKSDSAANGEIVIDEVEVIVLPTPKEEHGQ